MHYCCVIISREFPTDNVLEKILKPYNEEDFYSKTENATYPVIMWDYWQVGGRYNGQLKMTIEKDNDQWKYYQKNARSESLFRSYLLDNMREYAKGSGKAFVYREEDFYYSIGYRDCFLYVDGAKISDVSNIEDVGCYYFIDADGNAFTRSYFNGHDCIDCPDFDKELKAAIQKSKDCYICIVDLHD